MNECPYRPYCLLHKTPDSDVTKRQRSAALRIFHPPKKRLRFPTKIRLTKVMCLLFKDLCYMSNTSHVVQSKLCKKMYIKQQQQQQKRTTTKEENKEKNNNPQTKQQQHTHTYTTPPPPPPPPPLLPPKTKTQTQTQRQREKQIKKNFNTLT